MYAQKYELILPIAHHNYSGWVIVATVIALGIIWHTQNCISRSLNVTYF